MTRFITRLPRLVLILAGVLCAGYVPVSQGLLAATPVRSIPVTLGDYRFMPDSITIEPGETVQLELTNTDNMTPHNFTLKDEAAGVEVDIDVSAGKTETVELAPLPGGTYKFYCNKKLPFMKSHRKRGMEGTLIVAPAGQQ